MSMLRKFGLSNKFNDLRIYCAMILTADAGEILAPPGPGTSETITILHKMCGEDAAADLPGFAVAG
ncbi:MAG: hypothetical protein O7F75_12080 [Alphaproteobacteria bacterium]|nr:hypothetical protein [Alphaproteobacteria bacterium]